MGTWGTAIFSNDLAADAKNDYKEHIANGKAPKEARVLLQKEHGITEDNNEDSREFWLVLSLIEYKLGRLEDEVKEKAIAIIDSGENLKDWQNLGADAKDVKKREAVLEKLKQTLLSEQPAAKPVKKRPVNITPYKIGEVFYYQHTNEKFYLFLVYRHHTDKGGTYACAQQLDASYEAKTDFENIDLSSLSIRDTKPQMITNWHGRLYKSLIKQSRIGLAGVYTNNPDEIEKTAVGCYITRWEYFETGKRDYLFDF